MKHIDESPSKRDILSSIVTGLILSGISLFSAIYTHELYLRIFFITTVFLFLFICFTLACYVRTYNLWNTKSTKQKDSKDAE